MEGGGKQEERRYLAWAWRSSRPWRVALKWAGGRCTDGGLWEARVPPVGLDPPWPLEMLTLPSQLELPSGPVGVERGAGLRRGCE